MVVMIYAYESVYCGLHGINTGLSVSELDCEFANLGRSLFIDEYCCVDIHNT